MRTIQMRERPRVIGVMGSHRGDARTLDEAYRIGEGIAKRGHVTLTGGGGGTMRAASEGARKAGGLVVAVLPTERRYPAKGYPNDFVDVPIYTGMSDARNAINAKDNRHPADTQRLPCYKTVTTPLSAGTMQLGEEFGLVSWG